VADIVAEWLARNDDGIACVIANAHASVSLPESDGRVRRLTPERAKGLEFDLVVLIDPERFGVGVTGAVDRYVAMTRATSELVILTA
jgi:superfamily I DNA/RNA helicase